MAHHLTPLTLSHDLAFSAVLSLQPSPSSPSLLRLGNCKGGCQKPIPGHAPGVGGSLVACLPESGQVAPGNPALLTHHFSLWWASFSIVPQNINKTLHNLETIQKSVWGKNREDFCPRNRPQLSETVLSDRELRAQLVSGARLWDCDLVRRRELGAFGRCSLCYPESGQVSSLRI